MTPVGGVSNPGYGDFSPVGPIAVNYIGGSSLPVAPNYNTNFWHYKNVCKKPSYS